jgi:hypothetical protein
MERATGWTADFGARVVADAKPRTAAERSVRVNDERERRLTERKRLFDDRSRM